jgi:hypothetical protein
MTLRRNSTAGELSELLRTLRTSPATSEAEATAAERGYGSGETSAELSPTAAKSSRTPGKRSNPAFRLTGVYLPRSLADDVRRRLVGSRNLDLSELVTELLREWLASGHQRHER